MVKAIDAKVPAKYELGECVSIVELKPGELPDWFLKVPTKVQDMLIMRARGFRTKDIAAKMECSTAAVSKQFTRYDPKRAFLLPEDVAERIACKEWAVIEALALDVAKKGLQNGELSPYQALGQADMARKNQLNTRNARAYEKVADASAIRQKIEAEKFRDAKLPAGAGAKLIEAEVGPATLDEDGDADG